MKRLDRGPESAEWNNKLLGQLTFIKQHLRYPFNSRTITPAVILLLIVTLVARLSWTSFFLVGDHKSSVAPYFIIPFALLTIIVTVSRYLKTLRFASVHTPFSADKNRELVKQFLNAMHLAVYQHPDATEVFQIISKNIDAFKDQREIMVFIADDKRILVNSHFTSTGFTLVPSAGNYKKMAEGLAKWVARSVKTSGTDITI